jgi:hypothetical protein
MDIGAWLNRIGLVQYEDTFRSHGIDPDVLPDLTAEDLFPSASKPSVIDARFCRQSQKFAQQLRPVRSSTRLLLLPLL